LGRSGQEKASFLKKRSKKLSIFGGTGVETGTDQSEQRFFCFFFVHKKEDPSGLAETRNRCFEE